MIMNELVGLAVETGLKETQKGMAKFAARVVASVVAEGCSLVVIHGMNENRVPMKDIPEDDKEKVASRRMIRNSVVRGACIFAANEALRIVDAKIDSSDLSNSGDSAGLI